MELLGINPGRKAIVYFTVAILIGAFLLVLPISAGNQPISFIDALFTATSAICVTGLTVVDTGRDFSLFGQVVILILIQLGGLGILTFTTILLTMTGARLSFSDRLGLTQSFGALSRLRTGRLLAAIAVTTLTIELSGAIILFALFRQYFPTGEAFYYAVFHSVSAFCNAGISIFSNNLENFRGNAAIIFVMAALIISGGLGFIVITDLAARVRKKTTGLSLHTKICLVATAVLIVSGTIIFSLVEYGNACRSWGFFDALTNSFFQSVTARTAGFNTIPQANLCEISILITIILMFIGVCPGSTGGGIKTTTATVILLLVYNRFRGRQSVPAFRRSISRDTVIQALSVTLLAALVVTVMFALVMFAEERLVAHRLSHGWFVDNLFEVVSAFGTVGLSLGITPNLHVAGKIIIIMTMFIGRVGLLTLAFSLARPPIKGEITYADEPVMIG